MTNGTVGNFSGSSAGAGSGDFHVYRGVRRREYARQKYINEKATKVSVNRNIVRTFVGNASHACSY